MSELSKFKVYTDALEIVNAVLKSHKHFIHEYKYTLGNETVTKSLQMMDAVIEGLREYDKGKKADRYRDAIKYADEVESRILLASDNQCMDNEHAGWYIDHIPALRKQPEGLVNSLARRNGSSTDGQRTCD